MALQKTVKLSIFNCDPYDFTDKNGQKWSGFTLQGFDDTGVIHSFTSERPASKVHDLDRYDENRVQTFVLAGRVWNDKTKWREVIEA